MLIYEALKKDHEKLKGLLEQIEGTTERAVKRRTELLEKVKLELIPHARAEEKVLYDQLKKEEGEAEDLAYEGYEEHFVADHLMEQLAQLDPSDKRWGAKFSVLKENLEHHIKEEEGEIFKNARKAIEREDAQRMAEEFEAMKREILASLKEGGKPAPRKPQGGAMDKAGETVTEISPTLQ